MSWEMGLSFSDLPSSFGLMLRLFLCAALALVSATRGFAQDKDDIDAQIKKAMENPNKPAPKNPNMKQMEKDAMADIAKAEAEAEDKAEAAKQKAAAQALVDVKGPVALAKWT